MHLVHIYICNKVVYLGNDNRYSTRVQHIIFGLHGYELHVATTYIIYDHNFKSNAWKYRH